jgi:hypothetical protein
MPLQVPYQEFARLLTVMARFPSGVSVGKLLGEPELGFPKRTLQRRLERLVAEGRLRTAGQGRACHYCLVSEETPSLMLAEEPARFRVSKEWLSPEARVLREHLRKPPGDRMPVGYQGGFLEAYQPNGTFYLPADLRTDLAQIGRVGIAELPAGTHLRQVMNRLLIDLSWNSSRLEGNTYSLLETQRLLELGESAEGRAAEETQMILNHKAAIEMLADQAGEIRFNRYTLCNLHALLADNLLSDSGACGSLRSCPVGVSGTVYHPLGVPQQIEERFEQILSKAQAIKDPFEQSFFVMVHLPYLQPFEDVNKRVSRLAANIPFVMRNLCPLSFIDMEQEDYVGAILAVYELNRVEYLRDVFVWAYRRSCARYAAVRQTLGEPDPFRMRHREAIGRFVREVVRGLMDKRAAAKWIATNAATEMDETERARFIGVVETELSCLHEGNIARYRLRPSEFDAWNRNWK